MNIYLARPENCAGTQTEKRLFAYIRTHAQFKAHDILCPSLPRTADEYYSRIACMQLVHLARSCGIFFFVPFGDGAIHYRHWKKISTMPYYSVSIYELTKEGVIHRVHDRSQLQHRVLSKKETAERIWAPFQYMKRYA